MFLTREDELSVIWCRRLGVMFFYACCLFACVFVFLGVHFFRGGGLLVMKIYGVADMLENHHHFISQKS